MPKAGPRYAIYFVPAASDPLYIFGASIIGYDCYTGRDVPFAGGLDAADWRPLVRAPRVYGFHATLKAPFQLGESANEQQVCEALQRFASERQRVAVGDLTVQALGTFIALVPVSAAPALSDLAAAAVEAFDRFRAPLTDADRKRRGDDFTARQRQNLERWGYPYVFEDFRFHMTLTGSLGGADRERALPVLRHKFAMIAPALEIDRIVVARQADSNATFRVIAAAALTR